MTEQPLAAEQERDLDPLEWPDLPTVVGMPGHLIELEVGGHVCLDTGVLIFSARR
jgi:hypothetical protein